MITIPSTEPVSITAGDTIAWVKSLTDYPASAGWVLKYRLINASNKYDIVATSSGDDFHINVLASTSSSYAAGLYDLQAFVEKAGERYTISSGRLQIFPDLAAQATGYDNRSTARKILDALLSAYQSAAENRAFVQEYEIAGRHMKFSTAADWIAQINYWQSQVKAEERAQNINNGMASGNKLLVRFR